METEKPIWTSRVWPAVGVALVLVTVPLLTTGVDGLSNTQVIIQVAILIAIAAIAWGVVKTRRQRREYEDRLATWAATQARQEERLRIAGDLHDLVSHGLGLITVRAAAGQVSNQTDALTDIERVSRETTTELRRMLTVLREPDSADVPLRPPENLGDLPSIIQEARDAGLTVDCGVADLGQVSPGAQLTVCAVVREGLNNALRHAGPTSVVVEVSRKETLIDVHLHDRGPDGSWIPRPGAGHGLESVRTRVETLGGGVETGPVEGAPGFRLHAWFPDDGEAGGAAA